MQECIASAVIKEKSASYGKENIPLKTGGTPIRVSLNPKAPEPAPQLSHEDMRHMQTHGLSQHQTLAVAEDIRFALKNRNIIQPHLKDNLKDKNSSMDDFFMLSTVSNRPMVSYMVIYSVWHVKNVNILGFWKDRKINSMFSES